jgi:hypothetical protein
MPLRVAKPQFMSDLQIQTPNFDGWPIAFFLRWPNLLASRHGEPVSLRSSGGNMRLGADSPGFGAQSQFPAPFLSRINPGILGAFWQTQR